MKLLFRQRLFSWLDSYDIYNEEGQTVYTVKGELSWGHLLRIYDANGIEVGSIKEKVFSWLPCFEVYAGGACVGSIRKEFTFFKPRFNIDFCGWQIVGDCIGWEYSITDALGDTVAYISQELNWTDTYSIYVYDPIDALNALMLVLAIDAEKCSRN